MRRFAIVLAIVALVGAGCGKSKNETSSVSGTGTGGGKAPVTLSGTVNNHGNQDVSGKGSSAAIELEADDFYFNPTFVKAATGQKVTVEVKNEGKAAHTFTVDQLGIDQQVDPGKTAKVEVQLPSSGAVAWYCRFHRARGMQGAFYFNEGDRPAAVGGGTTPTTASGGSGGTTASTAKTGSTGGY
jgi:plastocyanin